ncbi:unnamed protein product [Vitrella brassicaformis CCMP3155]|uniref:RRM domain-containing protein n=3 Tax=Vitrella brassicaformis TaxID=1169539 RepID=A0A0G4F5B4_VITBC|nr:unnamed protein product [Vitrella brassicaformis CCMP3155]|eukprot:CEM07035.1 unnamed protein product [Vitrella brassicaformis CCMP3155]
MTDPTQCNIYITPVARETTEKQLNDLFSACGEVMRVKIRENERGLYAFVNFSKPDEAQRAVRDMQSYELHGAKMKVELQKSRATPPASRDPSSGGRRGPPTDRRGGPMYGDHMMMEGGDAWGGGPNGYGGEKRGRQPDGGRVDRGDVQLHLMNVPADTTEDMIRQRVEGIVPVTNVRKFIRPKNEGEKTDPTRDGYAFLHVRNEKDAEELIRAVDGTNGWILRYSNHHIRTLIQRAGGDPKTRSGLVLVREITLYGVPEGPLSPELRQAMRHFFSQFGDIENIEGTGTGIAFVLFRELNGATKAIFRSKSSEEKLTIAPGLTCTVMYSDPVQRTHAVPDPDIRDILEGADDRLLGHGMPAGPPGKRPRQGDYPPDFGPPFMAAPPPFFPPGAPGDGFLGPPPAYGRDTGRPAAWDDPTRRGPEPPVPAYGGPGIAANVDPQLLAMVDKLGGLEGIKALLGASAGGQSGQGMAENPLLTQLRQMLGQQPPPRSREKVFLMPLVQQEKPYLFTRGRTTSASPFGGPPAVSETMPTLFPPPAVPPAPVQVPPVAPTTAPVMAPTAVAPPPQPPPAVAPPPPISESPEPGDVCWRGSMVRSNKKRVPVQARFLRGRFQSVFNKGCEQLNISHRSSWEDVGKRHVIGVVCLEATSDNGGVPTAADSKGFFEYIEYFKSKERAGVARIEEGNQYVYIIPPGVELFVQHGPPPRGSADHTLLALVSTDPDGAQPAAAPTGAATAPLANAPSGGANTGGEHGKDQNGTDQEAALRALLQRPEVLNLLSQKDGK